MGYTHYWRRKEEYPKDVFAKSVKDIQEVRAEVERIMSEGNFKLAGANGSKDPIFDDSLISFNGLRNCGHKNKDLGIAWPSKDANGIGGSEKVFTGKTWGGNIAIMGANISAGGAQIDARTCGGSCSHEAFWFPRKLEPKKDRETLENGLRFDFTKTAYKPYDLMVNCCLIVLKHHLMDGIVVSSDGEQQHWADAQKLCMIVLEYGADFEL